MKLIINIVKLEKKIKIQQNEYFKIKKKNVYFHQKKGKMSQKLQNGLNIIKK